MTTGELASQAVFVADGKLVSVREEGGGWQEQAGFVQAQGEDRILWAGNSLEAGDFHVTVRLAIVYLSHSAASFVMEPDQHFGFEGATGEMFTSGPMFGRGTQFHGDPARFITPGEPFTLEVIRTGDEVCFLIEGQEVLAVTLASGRRLGMFGLRPWRSRMRVYEFSARGNLGPLPPPRTQPTNYTIPTIDLSTERARQVFVERTPGQYLGHPTTVLLADGRTILCTYPLGHGGPAAVLKKSTDGGRTWSERLPVPENWATATNCPCLHRLTDPQGVERLFVLEGNGKMRQAMSLDNGETWTPFEENGLSCVVAPINIEPIAGGRHLAIYHRGYQDHDSSPLTLWQAVSSDGGLTWQDQRQIAAFPGADLCEPAIIRSPDGKQLAVVMRENTRRFNSMLITSEDEGQTWSSPVEMPAALTGDRHMPRYAPDGRLVMTFRDVAATSPTKGDFAGWVGTYDDLVSGREGQYRVRFYNSPVKGDLGYPGLELLPDGTMVTTTYIVPAEGEKQAVMAFHFSVEELDRKAALLPDEQWVYKSGDGECHTYRIPSLIVSQAGTVLAFCEARRDSSSDFGNIDMVLRRSTDGGNAWGPIQLLAEDEGNTMGNPCPVVNQPTGEILLLLCRNNERVFIMRSTDDGLTFSALEEITEQVKQMDYPWTRVATGPGNGIQMRSGRLVIPMWYMAGEQHNRQSRSYRSGVIFSDDGGKTWQPGEVVQPTVGDGDECEVVEASDGRLCLNMRNESGQNRRAVAWSADGGQTWSQPEFDAALIEPACDGSMIRLRGESPVWLFANCASKTRNNMSVRISRDEGRTWSEEKVLYPGHSAYPCLTELPDGRIGCLYERGEHAPYEGLVFARFTLEWLTDGVE